MEISDMFQELVGLKEITGDFVIAANLSRYSNNCQFFFVKLVIKNLIQRNFYGILPIKL